MISNRIKNLIFEFILNDLYKVEIIYYRDSIWFIDRENRYWYFEYHKVDKHLWWRWSHFTTAMTMFSMEAEKEQHLFGELVNMILTKKQKLEAKYPNKIFKTVGSVMNFEDKVEEVLNCEIDTTRSMEYQNINRMDEALNCEVETTQDTTTQRLSSVDEVLNYEVEKTAPMASVVPSWVDKVLNNEVETTQDTTAQRLSSINEVLNYEVETTDGYGWKPKPVVDEVLNNEVNTTESFDLNSEPVVDEVLNYEVETTESFDLTSEPVVDEVETTNKVGSQFCVEADAVITFEVEKTSHGTLIDEDKIMDKVLSVDIETIGYSKTHRLRPVTGALDYNDNPVEIKSIKKLKGESPLQDIIVSHILDESDKVTDKLKMKEDDYVKTYSHDVYMCDHLVQNVLDVGVNSIHYDTHHHQPIVDGILKKA